MKTVETAVLILAAGASKRLGKPKQELLFHNQTLLARIATTAVNVKSGPVLVVVSNEVDLIEKEQVVVVVNHRSEQGMASSIHCGIENYRQNFL